MAKLSAFGAALLAAGPSLSVAADNSVVTIDPVIVTATRLDDVTNLPASVTVITAEQIAESPARTLPELLSLEAGVVARSLFGNNAARDTVDLRGFGSTSNQNTLILLDGRRLNDIDLSFIDFAAIPVANIERIEIIRGGGAVVYGDGAVGGAINIVTRGPVARGTRGSAMAGVGSYDAHTLQATASHGAEAYGFNVFANAIESEGYRENNDLKQYNVQADARVRARDNEWFLKLGADDQELRLPGERRVDAAAGVDQLATDRRGTNRPNDFSTQEGYAVTGGWRHALSARNDLIADVGYRFKNQTIWSEAFMSYLDTDLGTWSFTPRFRGAHSLLGGGGITTGVDYYQSQYDSARAASQSTVATPSHRLDVDQNSLAGYALATVEPAHGTIVTGGARVQRMAFSGRDQFDPTAPGAAFGSQAPDLDFAYTEPMYELGVRQALGPAWSAFVRAGRSVRFGTIDEIFGFDPVTFNQVFTPLKPQVAHSYDLGADYATAGYRLGIAGYYMTLNDEIAFNPATFANENLDPTRRYGATLAVTVPLGERARIQTDYAYTRALFRAGPFDGNDVPLVPAHAGSVTLFTDLTARLTFATAVRYVGEKRFANDDSNTFAMIPAYTMLDLKLTGRFGAWRVEGAVNNALDEEAFDFGVRSTTSMTRYNAYPLPERNYALSVAREF